MGVGLCTSEEVKYNPANGRLLNNDTWVSNTNSSCVINVVITRRILNCLCHRLKYVVAPCSPVVTGISSVYILCCF